MVGNTNNVLININVQNIKTSPIEVIAISNKTDDEVYGKKVQVGPFGDVLDITNYLMMKICIKAPLCLMLNYY